MYVAWEHYCTNTFNTGYKENLKIKALQRFFSSPLWIIWWNALKRIRKTSLIVAGLIWRRPFFIVRKKAKMASRTMDLFLYSMVKADNNRQWLRSSAISEMEKWHESVRPRLWERYSNKNWISRKKDKLNGFLPFSLNDFFNPSWYFMLKPYICYSDLVIFLHPRRVEVLMNQKHVYQSKCQQLCVL